MKILLVDDDEVSCEAAYGFLHLSGHEVATASNGLEACEILHSWMPDVIILDMRMPVMDGQRFLEVLRTTPKTEKLPVIVLSALDERELANLAQIHSELTVLAKPVLSEDLERALAKACPVVELEGTDTTHVAYKG